jgi:Domain of unknown function (DUF1905)
MEFTANVSRFGESEVYWTSIIIIPENVYQDIIQLAPNKRVVCTINNSQPFHCAMIPKKPFHYIMLSKEKIKILNLNTNDEISVKIIPDKSEFGMEISEEMQEVLNSDFDGNAWFEKLTAGKQRSLIYLISKTKNSQSRIEKSFVLIEHLKRNKGKFAFKIFNDDCKNFKSKNTL